MAINVINKWFSWIFILALSCVGVLTIDVQAAAPMPVENAPIHEAYAQSISGGIPILETVPTQPPKPIKERKPPMWDPRAIWIHGYWAWMPNQNDFIWISGIWRMPPPNMQWIPGYWTQLEEGWVWISGFWSDAQELNYLPIGPLDPLEEDVGEPPGEDYFWQPGYWEYSPDQKQYQWVMGSWQEIDPSWVLVPAHYKWRPEGYVFIHPYWDWPLEVRGIVYAPVDVGSSDRQDSFEFEPRDIVGSENILNDTGGYYPDYSYIVSHHFYYHRDFWAPLAPPWWSWSSWWTLSWHNKWALWWWYTHPEYPQPEWLSPEMAERIEPPTNALLRLIKKLIPPPIVTPNGVVPQSVLIQATGKKWEKTPPVLPANREKLEEIQLKAVPKPIPNTILRPTGKFVAPGKKIPLREQPSKPIIPTKQPTDFLKHSRLVPRKPPFQPAPIMPVKEKKREAPRQPVTPPEETEPEQYKMAPIPYIPSPPEDQQQMGPRYRRGPPPQDRYRRGPPPGVGQFPGGQGYPSRAYPYRMYPQPRYPYYPPPPPPPREGFQRIYIPQQQQSASIDRTAPSQYQAQHHETNTTPPFLLKLHQSISTH